MSDVGLTEFGKSVPQRSADIFSKPIYQVGEVAEILGVHPSTITKFLKQKVLAGVQVNGRYVWVIGASLRRFISGELA